MSGSTGNALAGERSPFLQHGAGQPVDWQPWGDAAFERARADQRPILLDIGAVWCHWCHVMDAESYDDPETAALINEHFVAVKVDRDERPDVDARYQRAVQLMTGQGGWPLTAFLTPDGEVFYGGTYFPPRDAHGRPSFRRVLTELARIWREDRSRALATVAEIRQNLTRAAAAEVEPGAISPELLTHVMEDLAESFDFRHGGFGRAPKFPNAGALDLLLDHAIDEGAEWARRVVQESSHAMARGGIYDQLGGGFHRYATDARWLVPHFEKMAYDNGVLLAAYARAAVVLDDPLLRNAAEGTIAHYVDVAPELRARGGFPASQDADFGFDNDGDYWTWTDAEVRAALDGDEQRFKAARLHYGLDDAGSGMHLDPSRHVLYLARTPEEVAASLGVDPDEATRIIADVRARLKRVRDGRPRPYVDETLYAGWVALVASGHLVAARHLEHDEARDAAVRALERVFAEGWRADRGVMHRIGDESSGELLEDHAHLALACIDAYEATHEDLWLTRAGDVAGVLLARFHDAARGAFRDRPQDAPSPVASMDEPLLPIADAPTPSGNASAALALLRLYALSQEERWQGAALGVLAAFAGSVRRFGGSAATYARALAWTMLPVTTIVIVDDGSEDARGLLRVARRTYRPRTAIRRISADAMPEAALPAEIAAMLTADAPRAYVCAGRTCSAPVRDADALAEVLRTLRG